MLIARYKDSAAVAADLLPVAREAARHFARREPKYRNIADDLAGEAALALARAIPMILAGQPDDDEGYVYASARNAVARYAETWKKGSAARAINELFADSRTSETEWQTRHDDLWAAIVATARDRTDADILAGRMNDETLAEIATPPPPQQVSRVASAERDEKAIVTILHATFWKKRLLLY